MRPNTEYFELLRAKALNVGGVTRISTPDLPVGDVWHQLILIVNHVVTIGTGVGPLSEGGLRAIRGIKLATDRKDTIIDNVPGRPLYKLDQYKNQGAGAQLDAIAAANGTYRAMVIAHFADQLSIRPMDTVLDTARYQSMTLEVTYGGVADLYSTVGTATVAPTLDAIVVRERGRLPDKIRPIFTSAYGVRPDVSPSTVTLIDLERAKNIAYKRLIVGSYISATAGLPFSGNADDLNINDLDLDHDRGKPFENMLWRALREINKQHGAFEAAVSGTVILDLVRKDGSYQSALPAGDKSRLRVQWRNGTVGASPQVALAYEALMPLR